VLNQAVAAISKATAFSIFGPFRPTTDLSTKLKAQTVGDTWSFVLRNCSLNHARSGDGA
jgi:hypothetical protein